MKVKKERICIFLENGVGILENILIKLVKLSLQ
jgi:hypothetical protein